MELMELRRSADDGEWMKHRKPLLIATSLLATLAAFGCNSTISKTKSTTTSSDGSFKSKETTVTQKADGTTVKTEETKKVSARP
jgi:hypothetical protein